MHEIQIMNTEPLFTLSVASRLSNTPTHSIRQYIDNGLIIPFKTKSNRHLFSEVDILRLKSIRKCLDVHGLNFAGIKALMSLTPCWILKPCSVEDRSDCEAYNSSSYPCWEATNKSAECKSTDCRTCNVYMVSSQCMSLKSLFKEMRINTNF